MVVVVETMGGELVEVGEVFTVWGIVLTVWTNVRTWFKG